MVGLGLAQAFDDPAGNGVAAMGCVGQREELVAVGVAQMQGGGPAMQRGQRRLLAALQDMGNAVAGHLIQAQHRHALAF